MYSLSIILINIGIIERAMSLLGNSLMKNDNYDTKCVGMTLARQV